jgi:hypothetical protein
MDPGAGYVLVCAVFDAASNTCTQTAWMPPPTLIPPLAIGDALALGSAIMVGLASIGASKLLERAL